MFFYHLPSIILTISFLFDLCMHSGNSITKLSGFHILLCVIRLTKLVTIKSFCVIIRIQELCVNELPLYVEQIYLRISIGRDKNKWGK